MDSCTEWSQAKDPAPPWAPRVPFMEHVEARGDAVLRPLSTLASGLLEEPQLLALNQRESSGLSSSQLRVKEILGQSNDWASGCTSGEMRV